MSTARRVWLGVGIAVLLTALLSAAGWIADRANRDVISGPSGSSYVTTSRGWAAYHDLLLRLGHPVERLEAPMRSGGLDPSTTLVIVEPSYGTIDDRQVEVLVDFLHEGGRLVLAEASALSGLADKLVDVAPEIGPARHDVWGEVVPVPEAAGVRSVRSSGFYGWESTGSAVPVVGGDGQAVVAAASVGQGRLVLLADPLILANNLLGEADNAVLGAAIVGGSGRTVVFNEFVHGHSGSRGLAALPGRWQLALVLAGLAVVVWLWAIGSRFVPAEPEDRTFPPSRALYVDALAATLARSADGPGPALREQLEREGLDAVGEDPVELAARLIARR